MANRTISAFGALTRFFDDIGRARDMAATYRRLDNMSDGALRRQGLSRTALVQEAARRCGF